MRKVTVSSSTYGPVHRVQGFQPEANTGVLDTNSLLLSCGSLSSHEHLMAESIESLALGLWRPTTDS